MSKIGELLLSILVFAGILAASAVATELFVRWAYYRCRRCRTINAKRRTNCRACGEELP